MKIAGTRTTFPSALEARRLHEIFVLAHMYSTVTRVYFSVRSAYTCHLLHSSTYLAVLYECVKGVLGWKEESTLPFWGIFYRQLKYLPVIICLLGLGVPPPTL